MVDKDLGSDISSERITAEEKLLTQTRERQEYMMRLKKWLDDARLWHYNLCARIPTSSLPSSNHNIVESVLRQYATLSQTNLLHQHFQNILLNTYSNNLNRNIQSTVFNTSEYAFVFISFICFSEKIFIDTGLT